MTTLRPWAINGKTAAGWRIDSINPQGLSGFKFVMNPVAIVPDKDDAELILKLANQDAKDNSGEEDDKSASTKEKTNSES